jgi:CHC2 zinc finger/Toprim domain
MGNVFLDHAADLGAAASAPIPQHVLDHIRDMLRVSSVAGKHVVLKKAGRKLEGLSPFNAERTPSFYVNDEDGVWYDFSSRQGGDVFKYVMRTDGVGFREAVIRCGRMVGVEVPDADGSAPPISPEEMARRAVEREAQRQARLAEQAERDRRMSNLAKTIAREAVAFTEGDGSPPALFLESRGLRLIAESSPAALRFHPHCLFKDDEGGETFHPALISIYRGITDDKVMAIGRRPLTPDGRSVSKPISLGPTTGCAVKLTADLGEILHISESVTSALGAAMLGLSPVWAVASASGMANFPVLPGVQTLGIVADNDANGTGQAAANECFARWRNAEREVAIHLPDTVGEDMADVASKAARP